jgi:hypothetical protein
MKRLLHYTKLLPAGRGGSAAALLPRSAGAGGDNEQEITADCEEMQVAPGKQT